MQQLTKSGVCIRLTRMFDAGASSLGWDTAGQPAKSAPVGTLSEAALAPHLGTPFAACCTAGA